MIAPTLGFLEPHSSMGRLTLQDSLLGFWVGIPARVDVVVTQPDIVRRVGIALRHLRQQRNLTQIDLSARLQAAGMTDGASSKTVSAWERGETPVPLTAFPSIAEAFRMEVPALSHSLGLCGDPSSRDVRREEVVELLGEVDRLPAEVVDDLMAMWRTSIAIARGRRGSREN